MTETTKYDCIYWVSFPNCNACALYMVCENCPAYTPAKKREFHPTHKMTSIVRLNELTQKEKRLNWIVNNIKRSDFKAITGRYPDEDWESQVDKYIQAENDTIVDN